MTKYTWSPLYLEYITHYGDIDSFRRASVCVIVPNSIYELSKWYKGCGFNPEAVCFASMEEAKKAGEAWVNKGV